MRLPTLIVCAALALPLAAQDLGGVRERQQRVGAEVTALAQRVRALVVQLEGAGASAEELRLYRATAEVLDRLATDDVGAILGALEELNRATTADTIRAAALDAYGRQQGVVSQLQLLGIEHEQRLRLQVLAAVYAELAERQTSARRVVANTARRMRATGSGLSGTAHDLLVRDQAALVDDLRRVGAVFGQSAQLAGGDGVALFQRAAAELGAAPPENAAEAGRAALEARRWSETLFAQNAVRQAARRAARLLRPDPQAEEAREEALRALRTLVLAQTNLQALPPGGDGFAAGDRQADVADGVVLVAPDVGALVPEAGAEVRLAFAALTQAVAFYDQGADPGDRQRSAVASLERAIQLLEEQTFQPPPTPERTQELAREAQQLAREQQEQARRPDAARQEAIRERTEALQREAASASVEAARQLAEATDAMQRAQEQASQQASEQARMEAQEAAAALERAARQLAQQAAQRQAAEARERQLAEARQLLDRAAEAVAEARRPEAGRETPREPSQEQAAEPASEQPAEASEPQAAERRAEAVAEARQALEEMQRRQLTPQLPSSAQAPVAEARASLEAAQREPARAEPQLAQAEAALERARGALELAERGIRADERGQAASEQQREAEARAREALQGRFTLAPTDSGRNEAENSGDRYDDANRMGELSPREREALTQARREPVSEDFAPQVEAYLRNLTEEPRP